MQYLLLCRFDEERWRALPDAERGAIMRDYGRFVEAIEKSGQHRMTAKLEPAAATTVVRVRNGALVTLDGPFAEAKEQIGGVHWVEARDLAEALAIAKQIPTLRAGGVVEVRAVDPQPR